MVAFLPSVWRFRRGWRFALTAGVLAGLLAGCGLAIPATESDANGALPVDPATQAALWEDCDEALLVESSSMLLRDGGVSLVCGEVIVPAVYDDPANTVNYRIQMMKLTIDPDADSRQAIFINPGGPGGSGVDQVQTSEFPLELLEEFDIIGFDPRGVGTSTFTDGSVIKCSDELDYLSYFMEGSPANQAEFDELIVALDEYYLDCVERNPLWWTLSTASVVRDLEIMRQVVTGDRPLNFIGSSYGTTIAGRYVTEFPDNVGKIVLDSPTTVNEDRIESALQSLEADEAKLRSYIERYARDRDLTFDEVFDRLVQIRQWADDDELYGYAGPEPAPGRPGEQISSEALFLRGILTLNYFDEETAHYYFGIGVDEAWDGRWNATFEWFGLYLDGYNPDTLEGETLEDKVIDRTNEYEVRVIVNTMDYSPPDLTEAQQRELSERSEEVAPLWSKLSADPSGFEYFGPTLGLSWEKIAREDPAIPDPPETPFIPANTSGVPLLIVGSRFESVTPYTFAEETAELLESPLISVDSSQHAPAAYYDSECVNDVLIRFFTTDEAIPDTSCEG